MQSKTLHALAQSTCVGTGHLLASSNTDTTEEDDSHAVDFRLIYKAEASLVHLDKSD